MHTSKPVPLFIFGVARSGTSYMHRLLNAHPQVRLSYEGCIVKEGNYYYRQFRNLQERNEFSKLIDKFCAGESGEYQNRWMLDVMKRHLDELFNRHRQNPSFANLVEDIYMLPEPVACWGNKMLRVEMCRKILRHWPEAKIVILIRDPRAVFSSQLKGFNFRIKYSAIYWNSHSHWTRQHAENENQYLVLKYEDFIQDRYAGLEKIFRLVGWLDPQITTEILDAHPPFEGTLYKYKKTLDNKQIDTIEGLCFDEMKLWGYKPEIARRRKRVSRLTRGAETILNEARFIPLDIDWWRRKKLLKRFLHAFRG